VCVFFFQVRYGPKTFPRLTLFPYLSIGPTESAEPKLILDVRASFILFIALHLKKEADLTPEIRHVSYPGKKNVKSKTVNLVFEQLFLVKKKSGTILCQNK